MPIKWDPTSSFRDGRELVITGDNAEFCAENELEFQRRIWSFMENASIYTSGLADEVYPGLWVGGDDPPQDPKFIEKHGIQVILNMCQEAVCDPPQNVSYFRIGIADGDCAPVGVYPKAAEIINDTRKAGRTILVHCAAGVSRSVTAVIAWDILYNGIGYRKSLENIRQRRPIANPHPLLIRSVMRDIGNKFIP
jgi:hypothetical protein